MADYILTVTYIVCDSSDNESTMIVTYLAQSECPIQRWYVMSVKYG